MSKHIYREDGMVSIYGLIDPRDNQLRYVGKAINLSSRLRAHLSEARRWTDHKANWIKSILHDGLKPDIFIIEDVKESIWQETERFWISYFRYIGCNLINRTIGGEGWTNPTEEDRKKSSQLRSESRKRYATTHPEEIKRIAQSRLGYKHNEETKRKIGEANKKRIWREESKKKTSERLKIMGYDNPLFSEESKRKQKEWAISDIGRKSKSMGGKRRWDEWRRKKSGGEK